jgi:predicted dehydrogenase
LEYSVLGIHDINLDTALSTAAALGVRTVFSTIAKAAAMRNCVFDIAVPGDQILPVLRHLPRAAAVLIQKPMGANLEDARRILDLCHEKQLIAAINFQLRFSPNMLALRDLLLQNALGVITDVEVRVVDNQPWQQWSFLKGAPRLEVLYHSIHYLDAIRFLVGEPEGVHCRAVGHPEMMQFRDTRSSIILDYGDRIRCSLLLNHTHRQNEQHRVSEFKVEGTAGAALLTMGVNLNYPVGKPDSMEVAIGEPDWREIPLRGSWFTEAFEGPMSNLQRFAAGEDEVLITSVDDAIRTMALVEACYDSDTHGTTPIPGSR